MKEKESLVGESPTQRSSMCKIDGSKRMTCLWKQVHFVRLIINQFKKIFEFLRILKEVQGIIAFGFYFIGTILSSEL